MNNHELQSWVEEVSERVFGYPFGHQATFNRRLRTTGGRYLLATHHIEMNERYLLAYDADYFETIIKHELCHYHLHLQGKGYQHKDQDFKRLLKQVGGSRFCQPIETDWRYCYQCVNCQALFQRRRRFNVAKYRCGQCRGQLQERLQNVSQQTIF